MITLALAPDHYLITISRDCNRGARLELDALIVLTDALSVEGLVEAAEFFVARARGRSEPSTVDRAMLNDDADSKT